MNISEYKESLRKENTLPTNFHVEIEELSTYKKWVLQFNTAINIQSGTEKQVSYAIKIKKSLVEKITYGILVMMSKSATLNSTNEINLNDDIFKLGYKHLVRISKIEDAKQIINIKDNDFLNEMRIAQYNLSKF